MSLRIGSLLALTGSMLVSGCGGPAAQPSGAPTKVTRVALGGFTAPADAVASPDGKTFYFTARTNGGEPAVFQVSSQPGSQAAAMATGAPLITPRGLVLSCDGATLYIAAGGKGGAPIYALATRGGPLAALAVTGIGEANGLAIGPDCETLFATGRTADDRPALFKVDRAGGAAQAVFAGAPLSLPSGVFVDPKSVAWIMDSATSAGVLLAAPADGSTPMTVISNLITKPSIGGVSLNSAGGTAVMSTRDEQGKGQLTSVDLATGERAEIPAPELLGPAGLRTARAAPVFAVADADGNAIFRAE